MNEITNTTAPEIIKLHDEIIGNLKTCLENAIRIGELLVEQKAHMKHGRFSPWIKEHSTLHRKNCSAVYEVPSKQTSATEKRHGVGFENRLYNIGSTQTGSPTRTEAKRG